MNSRLDAIQAAVLRSKLPYLGPRNDARRARAADYVALFRETLRPHAFSTARNLATGRLLPDVLSYRPHPPEKGTSIISSSSAWRALAATVSVRH